MSVQKYMPGSTWGGWTVISKAHGDGERNPRYWCRCQCGKRARVPGSSLRTNKFGCLDCSAMLRRQGQAKYPISITEIIERTGYTKGGVTSRIRRHGYDAALAFFLPQAAKELMDKPRRHAAPEARKPEPATKGRILIFEVEGTPEQLDAAFKEFSRIMGSKNVRRETRPARERGRETRG